MADREQDLESPVTGPIMFKRSLVSMLAAALLAPVLIGAAAQEPATPAAVAEAAPAAPACDAALGRRVFGQCAICHSLEKDAAPIAGPNLHGVVGRPAASTPGFSYSKALRASGKRWTPEELDRFLTQPASHVPGTTMAFAGLKRPEERTAVICHLTDAAK